MLFNYKAFDASGRPANGSIDALTIEVAVNALQRRGFTVATINPVGKDSFFKRDIGFWNHIGAKDIVILSRQISTLFEAQVSALRIFRLLAVEVDQPFLRQVLISVSDEIQAGSSISKALGKHPEAFSSFYVSMVRSGEEAGKLDVTFGFLADYLERTYEVTAKAKNALIYPIFVIITFVGVMVLMFTTVIPSISTILTESGQTIPIYTRIVLGISHFLLSYGWFLLILLISVGLFLWRFGKTPNGRYTFSELKIRLPYIGNLFRKLYLSRIADNLHTQLSAAIPIIRSIEITAEVVDNAVFESALAVAAEEVKGGSSIADAFSKSPVIPSIMIQMIKVGEESGELGTILETMARFYRREVSNAVDTLVSLIEPALIVLLGLGVGFLLASVLIPIYSIAGAS
ncbi:MAG: type II secretion system F family protein [Candidatus Taylorbacteria bacterium]|nr:type II secretion system F family protein [Candidatus Taylorbacteria bacterium]